MKIYIFIDLPATYKSSADHHRYSHVGSSVPYPYSRPPQVQDNNPSHHDNMSDHHYTVIGKEKHTL